MAISRKEKEIPKNLPPARIYLDDLEMVIRVFQEAKQSQADKPENQPVLKFEIENQECTELTDLPKIAETKKNFSMEVVMPDFSTYLRISPESTYWATFGLERKEEWSLHSRLEPIFRGRETPLVALAHKVPSGVFWLAMGIIGTLILFPMLVSYSIPMMFYPLPSRRIPLGFALGLLVLWGIRDNLTSSHTILVFSRYAESSAKRRDSFTNKAWDIAKIVLGPIIGALILWLVQHRP